MYRAENVATSARFVGNFLQTFPTSHATAAVQCRVLCGLVARAILPVVVMDVDAAMLEAVELERWLVLRVEGRETIAACRTMEEYHVAENALSLEHLA